MRWKACDSYGVVSFQSGNDGQMEMAGGS